MAVAKHIQVEILVADSRQVYRGMDVGTAKPDAAARAAVPHHLIDLVEPDQPFTVADWVGRARAVLPEIAARGRVPLLVGGTGLYVSALVDGHDYAVAGHDPDLRATLADVLERQGMASLASRLVETAPALAASIDLQNPRRVLRALERSRLRRAGPAATPYRGRIVLVGLERPRDVLFRRIDQRAGALFASGLLDEVSALVRAGYGAELRPMTGHGYAEAMRHLMGEWTLDQAIEVTARRTRQYAKRQLTWFRRQVAVTWLEAGERPGDAGPLVAEALHAFRAATD